MNGYIRIEHLITSHDGVVVRSIYRGQIEVEKSVVVFLQCTRSAELLLSLRYYVECRRCEPALVAYD